MNWYWKLVLKRKKVSSEGMPTYYVQRHTADSVYWTTLSVFWFSFGLESMTIASFHLFRLINLVTVPFLLFFCTRLVLSHFASPSLWKKAKSHKHLVRLDDRSFLRLRESDVKSEIWLLRYIDIAKVADDLDAIIRVMDPTLLPPPPQMVAIGFFCNEEDAMLVRISS